MANDEERYRQERLEKLIDWELSKQLTWAVVLLTTILGLLALLGTNALSGWINGSKFPIISFDFSKFPLFFIFIALLFFGIDFSFYRLAVSLKNLRNFIDKLPSDLQKSELRDKAILKCFYESFVEKCKGEEYELRSWWVFFLIAVVDILFITALLSV